MNKFKSLYNIVIDGCTFNTRLWYNTKTNHIGINTQYQYQKEYNKEYRKNNKDKISEHCNKNKNKLKEYREFNRDPNISRFGSKEYKIKCSCSHQKIDRKDWNGFVTESPYCHKFNESLKEKIREKYNRKCFICGKLEKDNRQKLSVHHIDMNKNQGCDNNEWRLIPLCMSCHGMVHNSLWKNRLKYLIK